MLDFCSYFEKSYAFYAKTGVEIVRWTHTTRFMSTRFDWETIRAEYEAGATQGDLSRRHGCSKTAIQKRIRSEQWTQGDVNVAINRLVAEKVAGVVATDNPKKRAKAIACAADKRIEVVERHKEEWTRHQALIDRAVAEENFDLAKLCKITAETIQIRQAGERKAWGLEIAATPYSPVGEVATQRVQVAIVVQQPPAPGGFINALAEARNDG